MTQQLDARRKSCQCAVIIRCRMTTASHGDIVEARHELPGSAGMPLLWSLSAANAGRHGRGGAYHLESRIRSRLLSVVLLASARGDRSPLATCSLVTDDIELLNPPVLGFMSCSLPMRSSQSTRTRRGVKARTRRWPATPRCGWPA